MITSRGRPRNHALRVVQSVSDADFEVEAKYESMPTALFQDEGILVEQDAKHSIRFDVSSDGTTPIVVAATLAGSTPTVKISTPVRTAATPFWLRVKRTGQQWLLSYSRDGVMYTAAGSFSSVLYVTKLGPYAGSAGNTEATPWTVVVDHFFNTASPTIPEDGARSDVPIANDDFSAATLNASKWRFVNPGGTSTLEHGWPARGDHGSGRRLPRSQNGERWRTPDYANRG